jgi:3-deoxy-D-manno-octulosonic-acid transferase
MVIIYDLIFLVVIIFYLPIYLFKKKFHRGLLLRLGILPQDLALNRPIWIHAVSVGEVMAVRGLLQELRRAYPQKRFVISTVTSTGNKIAKGIAGEDDFVTYLPLDLSFIVRCVLDRVNPSLFIIVETEIWPNLLSYLYRKNIPSVVVNGRISDRSFRGYLSIKFLLKPILNKVNLFCVQTPRDASRLTCLGVSGNKIQITGNMKFDNADYTDKIITDYADKYKTLLRLGKVEKLWVAGSTHPGEEEIILSAYRKLLAEFPDLRLLIAPRHPQRSKQVEKLIAKFGFGTMFISTLNLTPKTYNPRPVFILDTVGELLYFYSIADIVFVGGSLVKTGGHNILEPASLAKPILFGPYMFNFKDIADLFLEKKAGILVRNEEELKMVIKDLLSNPSKITQFCQFAKELILENQGATRKNLRHLLGLT